MGAISREILLYSLYVFITLTISYSLREEQGYWQTIDIEELFNLKVRTGAKFTVKTDQFKKVSINPSTRVFMLDGKKIMNQALAHDFNFVQFLFFKEMYRVKFFLFQIIHRSSHNCI